MPGLLRVREVTMPERVTAEEAIENAARLLRAAEVETNLPLMERLDSIADTWVAIAQLLTERERV